MKIEMGESLFYSWLRHVKECQIVQNNWKVSPQWQLNDADEIEELMHRVDAFFKQKYGYNIFKKNTSLSQLLQQGECDVLGTSIQSDEIKYYAIDVAFHESGLNYGDRNTTVMKVLEKCARTAFCLHGYLFTKEAEIIFASPKINPAVLTDLESCVQDINEIFWDNGYQYKFRIIANDEYNDLVLKPILIASEGVSDTSELFLRGYQMFKMFSNFDTKQRRTVTREPDTRKQYIELDYSDMDAYKELKIGMIAQHVLARMLEAGCAAESEIAAMKTAEYSKQQFDIQYPLLIPFENANRPLHYYAKPVTIYGKKYRLCCEWFEKEGANNDRPYLLSWIKKHMK